MTLRVPVLLLATTTLLASCAYYNGLYNAKDIARRAEKLERQGRTGDAQGLWDQVAVRAETVVVRHPNSRWTNEARFYQGKALAHSGHCDQAVAPLELVLQGSQDVRLDDEAALELSNCRQKLGDPEGAGFAVERLLNSPDRARRAEASWRTGVAYRRTGRQEESILVLRGSEHPRARGELAAALAESGRIAEARALADSLLAERDSIAPWSGIIAGVGIHDPLAASELLDTILAQLAPIPDSAATWLSADAARLLPVDRTRSLARFEQAFRSAPARSAGVSARIRGLSLRLHSADDLTMLDTVRALLGDIEPGAGAAALQAAGLVRVSLKIREEIDSLDPTAPLGDLRGFLIGESLRDSLAAPRLAAEIWRGVLTARPESPYAPKILLALAGTGTLPPDSVARVLEDRYAASPYVLVLHGGDDPGYRALEDSLGKFSASLRAAGRPTRRPPPRGTRPTTSPTPAAPVQ